MGWNSWNKFALQRQRADHPRDRRRDGGERHEGRRLSIRRDRRLLAGRARRPGLHPADAKRFRPASRRWPTTSTRKGLKFGIYSDAGPRPAAAAGSQGHEYQDAPDLCAVGRRLPEVRLVQRGDRETRGRLCDRCADALRAAGRPIVFSICEWGNTKPWQWGGTIGNLWRTTGDIIHCFDCKIDHGTWFSWGVMQILDLQERLLAVRGPGPLERSRHAGGRQRHGGRRKIARISPCGRCWRRR